MRKILFFILSIIPLFGQAQIYKYIGVEDGLSDQQVFSIQKGTKGYMWFLTRYGVDRYDGKNITHYKLFDGEIEVNSMFSLGWLYVTPDSSLWEVGRRGHLFRYDYNHDSFNMIYQLPDSLFESDRIVVDYAFIDDQSRAWFFQKRSIHLYDSRTRKDFTMPNVTGVEILSVVQQDSTTYYLGTTNGVYVAHLEQENGQPTLTDSRRITDTDIQVDAMYLHKETGQLFIATLMQNIRLYDTRLRTLRTIVGNGLNNAITTCIRPFNDDELLIATNGSGVYKMNIRSYECEPYIVADYSSYNSMNGNNIYDLYVDNNRIWMSNYPVGITMRDNQFPAYQWIKHAVGNPQSLVNNQVNYLLEDSDGDLWYATNNGISLYRTHTRTWHSFLNQSHANNQPHIILTMCEVRPGVIWASGYGYTIYEFHKNSLSVRNLEPAEYKAHDLPPDKMIRTIYTDSAGMIWSGGYYNLKRLDYNEKKLRIYSGINGVTDIIEKDRNYMWIGTSTGLYLLHKEDGSFQNIHLPTESFYVTTLYQTTDGLLYIGTNSSGMIVYDPQEKTFERFYADNSGLLSNCINAILGDEQGDLVLSTDHGLSKFNSSTKQFRNWTKDQGLKIEHFNPQAGILCRNGNFVFGSSDGAVEFNKHLTLPVKYDFNIIFSSLSIFYRTVYPGDANSPLKQPINETDELKLRYDQNSFSIQVSSINYDYPSLPLYTWKLDGFYDQWSQPDENNRIRFTNLNPGKYVLYVRVISGEDQRLTLNERSMTIVISQPIWLTVWAWLLYALIAGSIAYAVLRYINMRRQRLASNEKIGFFVNTAHDIRTPLTLIKAPLEEVSEKEELTLSGRSNLNTALRNVNALLRLTNNLINFERADIYSSVLYVSTYELGAYMNEIVSSFRAYAESKQIHLTYESNFAYQNVLIDKDKMDSILKNILSNALKYTPEGGKVHINTHVDEHQWSVEIKDNGIGVPASEQKNLFKTHFRSSNAINSKVTGSGIGLMLVWKLVRIHKGKVNFHSAEGEGTEVRVAFPIAEKYYHKSVHRLKPASEPILYSDAGVPQNLPESNEKPVSQTQKEQPSILVVEDNDELRSYLLSTLSDNYTVQVCDNGKAALELIREHHKPDLIISDVMMPEMRGDELCNILKNDIETSHIPIILLTALATDENIIEGLNTGADKYIVKPFNIGILRANIASLLNNRALLRQRYTSLEPDDVPEDDAIVCINCSELDREFLKTVRGHIEDNLDKTNFNVDSLCTLLFMSRTSFYNKIKALTGQPPADYIRLIRLKQAARLLRERRYSIAEIADMTGFSDAKYFREVFKKHYQVSPSQYVKQT
ncbi:MAG: response regulator [Mediterranea sp.]|nr:response regulator [Mediterranea sp.]